MSLSLAAESWTWYAFVILVVMFRFASRIMHLGSIKRLQAEDYIMLFIACIYTVLVTFMNIVAFVDTNLMLPGDIPNLTPESIQSRIYGSKLVLLVEQCMITTQWGCKICLLLIYHKLTMGLNQRWAVKLVGGYVVLGWLIMEILYFGVWCQPFNNYWAVPVSNIQCSAAINHLIVNAVFNITSDLMMLCIPLPLLINSQLPPLKKTILCGLFGLGIFVILCAALNKYYSFTQPFSPVWTFWYIREASTAILVANIPNCWPLLRRIFHLRSFSGSSDQTHPNNTYNSTANGGGRSHVMEGARHVGAHLHQIRSEDGDEGREGRVWGGGAGRKTKVAKSESLEYINGSEDDEEVVLGAVGGEGGAGKGKDVPLEIWQDVEVRVHKFDVEEGYRGGDGDGDGDLAGVRRKDMYDGLRNEGVRTVVSARPL